MTRRDEAVGIGGCSLLCSNSSGLTFCAPFPSCGTISYSPCFTLLTLRLKCLLSWLGEQTGFVVDSIDEAAACNPVARVPICLLRGFLAANANLFLLITLFHILSVDRFV